MWMDPQYFAAVDRMLLRRRVRGALVALCGEVQWIDKLARRPKRQVNCNQRKASPNLRGKPLQNGTNQQL